MLRLNADNEPCAVIKAGVRIFSNGRSPKDGASLAVTRREARAMRRRRDRLLKRKARMMRTLVEYGFFPADEDDRKELEVLNPFRLRAEGLDRLLTPAEFGRALFHINQRRGFKSNRKTDKKDNDSGALKTAINRLRENLKTEHCRTVGEWLNKRDLAGQTVRARYRQNKVVKDDGNTDQGSQFTSSAFIGVLQENEIQISMDGKGCWRDNVFVERLWKSVKYEEVYLHGYDTVSTTRQALVRYFDFYNRRRPHSTLDGKTPDTAYFNLSKSPLAAAA